MVKSKKMSKTSIAVIVLALLLVLSLCLGITGAWFTDKQAATGSNSFTMKFGEIDYTLAAETTVKNGDAEAEKNDGKYALVALTTVQTSITVTNDSTVASYYVLVQEDSNSVEHYFVIDETNKVLVEINSGAGLVRLAAGDSESFTKYYRVKEGADAGTLAANIWEESTDGTNYTGVTIGSGALAFDADVDLGLKLVNGQYVLRAVQAENMEQLTGAANEAAGAYAYLTDASNFVIA